MIDGQRVLAVIPARGGSKGLPRKNVLPLGGRPLIGWSIDSARDSQLIDRLILSSDDDEIMQVAGSLGCEVPFRRPAELASDSATTMDALRHALEQCPGYDIVVVLQPTNPLRAVEDIDGAIYRMIEHNADSCVSVTEPDKSPYWSYRIDDAGRLVPLLGDAYSTKRRQELPTAYTLNGVVYVARVDWFLRTGVLIDNQTIGYPMPKERSIDIDSALDLRIAELLLNQQQTQQAQAHG